MGFDRARLAQLLRARSGTARVRLGLRVADATRYSPYQGAYIGGVAAGSSAEFAGLQSGDIIVSVDTQRVNSAAGLQEAMARLRPGQESTIAFLRNEQALQVRIVV